MSGEPAKKTSAHPARIPLTGADAFLLAFDAETRRRNRANHLSQVVLRLGPGFSPDEFARVLGQVVDANPILRAPIRRRGVVGHAEYRLDLAARAAGPVFELHETDAPPPGDWNAPVELPELFAERLNELHPGGRAGLLRADAVRYADGRTDLALTWLHMLFDGWGSERFVEFLEECRSGARTPDAVPAADRPGAPPDVALPAASSERGNMAMEWQRWMNGLGRLPVRSPAGPERGARQDLAIARAHLSASNSARVVQRAAELAGFLTPMIFYLGVAIRAHHAVMVKRGAVPASYVVPLPVNLRPKGSDGGIFRTRVSLLWFQVPSACVDDLDALLAALRDQRRNAIRSGQIENGAAAMDFARYAPSRLYGILARYALGGELCSFFFAFTGEFCPGLARFFGAEIEDGFGVPSVPASPGSGLVLALHAGRVAWTHVRQRDAWQPGELEVFRQRLAADLLG
ncbi:MAG TPA: hypothetical protein VKH41_10440 [Myxococcota bacterium]|nr:hypothetical protein [Myxococcota bacterium]